MQCQSNQKFKIVKDWHRTAFTTMHVAIEKRVHKLSLTLTFKYSHHQYVKKDLTQMSIVNESWVCKT